LRNRAAIETKLSELALTIRLHDEAGAMRARASRPVTSVASKWWRFAR
jgi:hypothetical protein